MARNASATAPSSASGRRPRLRELAEARAGLDGELVAGQVREARGRRARAPRARASSGDCPGRPKMRSAETRGTPRARAPSTAATRAGRVVEAPEEAQPLVARATGRRWRARFTPCVDERARALLVERGRVALDRDLRARRVQPRRRADAAEHTAELAAGPRGSACPRRRRRSRPRAPARPRRRALELAEDGVGVARVVDGLALVGVADEVAVRALGQAPREVDVDAAPRIAGLATIRLRASRSCRSIAALHRECYFFSLATSRT